MLALRQMKQEKTIFELSCSLIFNVQVAFRPRVKNEKEVCRKAFGNVETFS